MGTIADIEAESKSTLDRLSMADRVAFAAACAERLLHIDSARAPAALDGCWSDLATILDRLWAGLDGPPPFDIQFSIDLCEKALVPEDEGDWNVERALTDDAVSALIYALTCWKSGQAQDAIWASRRALEALHYFVEDREPDTLTWSAEHQSLFDHPLVVAELDRQRADLAELTAGQTARSDLRARARSEASRFIPGRS